VTRPYYGWAVLFVAAAAMVGTLPGRTQGLGLITPEAIGAEPDRSPTRATVADDAESGEWTAAVSTTALSFRPPLR
jgi:hypothetical protein